MRLNAHIQKTLREANGKTMGISLLLEKRVKVEGVLVDLAQLVTVKALAQQLLQRGQKLDAVVWNAGIILKKITSKFGEILNFPSFSVGIQIPK